MATLLVIKRYQNFGAAIFNFKTAIKTSQSLTSKSTNTLHGLHRNQYYQYLYSVVYRFNINTNLNTSETITEINIKTNTNIETPEGFLSIPIPKRYLKIGVAVSAVAY